MNNQNYNDSYWKHIAISNFMDLDLGDIEVLDLMTTEDIENMTYELEKAKINLEDEVSFKKMVRIIDKYTIKYG